MKNTKYLTVFLFSLLINVSFSQVDSLNTEMFKTQYKYYDKYSHTNFSYVIDLVKKGADINAQDEDGNTLLHLAARHNNWDLAKLLCFNNAKTDIKNNNGKTAKEPAVDHMQNEVIDFFKEMKYDMYFLAKYGTYEALKENIETTNSEINKPDKHGLTLLDHAVRRSKDGVRIVNYLINEGVDINFNYINVLDIAILNNNIEIAKLFSSPDSLKIYARPLRVAIETHNIEMVKLLVEKGIKMKDDDYLRYGPLEIAFRHRLRNIEIIRYLIEKGAGLEKSDWDDKTALHKICEAESYEVYNYRTDDYYQQIEDFTDIKAVKLLLDKGVEINALDIYGNTALHYAAQNPSGLEVINYLIDIGAKDDIKNKDGKTPYDMAILSDNIEGTEAFISRGEDFQYIDSEKNTLIHKFIVYDEASDLIDMLIKKGLNPKAENSNEETPLYIAIKNNKETDNLKKLLVAGVDLNKPFKTGKDPIDIAIWHRKYKLVKFMVENGVDINYKDKKNNSLLHLCSREDDTNDLINSFIKLGINPKHKNINDKTALHIASAYNSNINNIKELLDAGVNINQIDKSESTALHYAAYNNIDIVKFLLQSGSDINAKNKLLQTPLDRAISGNKTKTAKYLLSKGAETDNPDLCTAISNNNIEMVKLMLSLGADINTCNDGLRAPIQVAAEYYLNSIYNYLIDNGAEIKNNKDFYKGFLQAVENNNEQMVLKYINRGFDVSKRYTSKTPLHMSVRHPTGNKITKILIDNGANINAIDKDLMTPLNYALKNNNINTVNLIKAQIDRDKKKTVVKNSFSNDRMVIYDRIPLDTLHYKESNDTKISFLDDLYYESENFNNIDFKQKFYDKISTEKISGYSDFYPYLSPLKKANIFNPPLSLEVINNRLGATIETGFDIDPETGDLIKRIYQNEACLWEIDGIMFYDNWIFDEDNYTFEKEVLSYSPIRRYFSDEMLESRYSLISFIDFEKYQNKKDKKKIKKRAKLFKKVKYEFLIHELSAYLTDKKSSGKKDKLFYRRMDVEEKTKESPYKRDQFEKEKSPYWTSINREKIVESIFSRVISDKSNAYDFETGELLSLDKIYKRMGAENDTVYDIDPYSGETIPIVLEKGINLDKIKSVIFIEDWYLDEETMQIVKEVIGIAPVKDAVKQDDLVNPNSIIDDWLDEDGKENKPTKTIPFVVYFKDMNQNAFDEKKVSVNTPGDNNYMTFNSGIINKHYYYREKNTPNINFKELFINKVINGDVKLYINFSYNENKDFDQNSYKIIDTTEILSRIGISYDTIQTYNADGETVKELVKSKGYGTDSISVIRSHEEWTFDADNFKFYKNVISYSPAVRFYREDDIDCDDPRNKLIGYVLNKSEGKSLSNMTLFKKIKYEFGDMNLEKDLLTDIPNIEDEKPLFWNSYNQKTFKECIFKIAASGNINSYDFNSGKKLSSQELEQNLILSTDTVYDIDPETGETIQFIVNNTIDYTSINSFIFIENHYIDEKNLYLKKEVVGIAPVVYFISDPETKKYQKVIPFVLYFDESKRF